MASMRVLNHIFQRRHLIMSNTLYCHSIVFNIRQNAWYSTKKFITEVDPNKTNNKKQIGIIEEVKENLKSAGYLGVIIGIGITALIFSALFSEFSSKTAYAVYNEARLRCIEHPIIMDILGAPVKTYGDETRCGHRRHISYMYYIKQGIKYIRIQFYVEGTRKHAVAYAEVKENESGNYEYIYLYVIVNHGEKIVIENKNIKRNEEFYKYSLI